MNAATEAKKRVLEKIMALADAAEGERLKKRKTPPEAKADAKDATQAKGKGEKTGDEDEEADQDEDKRRLLEAYEKMK